MRRASDRDVVRTLDNAIRELDGVISRFDRTHFPSIATERRLDRMIERDHEYKRRQQREAYYDSQSSTH